MNGTRDRKVSFDDIERVFTSGNHPSGSADRKIHERYLPDVLNDRLDTDALLFYGACLEPTDIRFIKPWVDAMQRLIEVDKTIMVRIRLRHGMSFYTVAQDARDTDIALKVCMREIGTRLRTELMASDATNPRLNELVSRLDCTCT